MKIQSGVFVAPHPDKVKSGTKAKSCKTSGHAGEDAYFKCVSKNGLNYGMGVADGVYMWSEHGIDAGQFSKSLMNVAQEEVLNDVSSVSEVMKTAAERAKQNEILGSSTFCVTLIDTLRGTLQVSNLGDSGVLVLGKEGVKFKTIQQEHTFGCPFQLGHHDNSDRPEDALVSVVPVTVGDIIISGTDGLFDNLSEENAVEIAEDVRRRHPGQPPALIASMLANQLGRQAFQNSMDKYISTPYSEAATDAFDMVYSGGKPDDMTVLTAIICSATE
jgi:protein phosphatase PTC7